MTVHKIKIMCNLCQKSLTVMYDDEIEPFWTDDDAAAGYYRVHHIIDHTQKGDKDPPSYKVEGVA